MLTEQAGPGQARGWRARQYWGAKNKRCHLSVTRAILRPFRPTGWGDDSRVGWSDTVWSIECALGISQGRRSFRLQRCRLIRQGGGASGCAFVSDDAELWVIERHGYRGYEIESFDAKKAIAAMRHLENLCRRPRKGDDEVANFKGAMAIIDAAIKDIGRDWTCDLFFEAERRYWQRKNRAAQVQKARQDKLGLGWANHDHHTYRSGRENYTYLIAALEKLGFHCRERFYAGAEAGFVDIDPETLGMSVAALRQALAIEGQALPSTKGVIA